MTGDERHARGVPPVEQRNARVGSGGDSGGHPRHHLPRDARRLERLGFFPAAAEDERVAALEANHRPAQSRVLDEEPMNLLLRHAAVASALSHVENLRARSHVLEHAPVNERIDEDDVALPQYLGGP